MRLTAILVVAAVGWCSLAGAAGLPELQGWQRAGEVSTFGPDSLWEYINGAADLFLSYGFRQLDVGELESGGVRVTVGVYDMGTPLDAFGVFRTEAAGGTELPVAAGAMVSPPYQCLLAKDRYYVKVEAAEGEITAELGKALVTALARALPGADGRPEAVQLLPHDGIVPGSVGYTRKGFLGLSELPPCVHAELAGAGDGAQVFVVVPHQGQSAEGAWRALGGRWKRVESAQHPTLVRTVPYRGFVGVVKGERGILGVAGFASQEELLRRLEGLAL